VDEDRASEALELLRGVGAILMAIDAKLESIVNALGGDDGEEED